MGQQDEADEQHHGERQREIQVHMPGPKGGHGPGRTWRQSCPARDHLHRLTNPVTHRKDRGSPQPSLLYVKVFYYSRRSSQATRSRSSNEALQAELGVRGLRVRRAVPLDHDLLVNGHTTTTTVKSVRSSPRASTPASWSASPATTVPRPRPQTTAAAATRPPRRVRRVDGLLDFHANVDGRRTTIAFPACRAASCSGCNSPG